MQYTIEAEPFPVAICTLADGETMISQSGSMAWMSSNMVMNTEAKGGLGGIFGRAFTGESIFMINYTPKGEGYIAFSSSYPGSIMAVEIGPGSELVVQKDGFLAGTAGITLSTFFQKKLGAGLFGGEGFLLQKVSGQGTAFIEIDGGVKSYTLAAGQQIILDTGYLAAMDATCSIDIQSVKGVKNMLFGGEGIFNTVVTGPGRVFIQTKPILQLVGILRPYFPSSSN